MDSQNMPLECEGAVSCESPEPKGNRGRQGLSPLPSPLLVISCPQSPSWFPPLHADDSNIHPVGVPEALTLCTEELT